MQGYVVDIEHVTEENSDFRRVLYTGKYLQLVLMALAPGEAIGAEVHAGHDQFFRVEKGRGTVMIDDRTQAIKSGDAIVVPAGARHNIVNSGDKTLRLYTLYGPPNHRDGVCYKTRDQAESAHEHFDGKTSEVPG